jgi:hypothetical protein
LGIAKLTGEVNHTVTAIHETVDVEALQEVRLTPLNPSVGAGRPGILTPHPEAAIEQCRGDLRAYGACCACYQKPGQYRSTTV